MDKREMYNQHKAHLAQITGHVCVCKGVAEETIKEAVTNGASDFDTVKEVTSAGSGCSMCQPLVEDIITA